MLRVLLVLALATCALGTRERYEGWDKPDKPKNVIQLEWQPCDAECGLGTQHETTRDWTIGCNNFPCETPLTCLCGNTDFLFVLDNTGSITQKNFFVAKQFVMDLMKGLSRYGGPMAMSRVGLITFADYSWVEFDFNDGNTFGDVDTLAADIWKTEKQNGFTNTSGALYIAGQMFKSQQSSNKKAAIVLTDGVSNIDEDLVASYAQELRDAGIGMYAMGVGFVDEAELKVIASKPEEKFYYYAETFDALEEIISQMMEGLCCTIPPPSCTQHSETDCSAACGGGVYEKVSTCIHYGFDNVVVWTETVVETFECNTTPCPTTVVCTHDDHTHEAPETWQETCTCTETGETVCEEEVLDPHGNEGGETSPSLGCRWAKVWHDPGTQWIQDVSGSRLKNCTCSDPPPNKWHIWTYCEPICQYEGEWYQGGDTFSFPEENGGTMDCECKSYAKLNCKLRKVRSQLGTDPVKGCKYSGTWHPPGTTWTENVSGGRMKECACSDPPPEFWNIDNDCIAKCDFNGQIYHHPDEVQWTDPETGNDKLCKCTSSAQMQCNNIRE